MKKIGVIAVSLILAVFLCASAVSAQTPVTADKKGTAEVTESPILRMKHWKNSTIEEKKSFILGVATMLGVNKYWMEKNHNKAYQKSPIATLEKCLSGVTYDELLKALDQYAVDKPEDENRAVIEVLWYLYCKPGSPMPVVGY